MFDDATTMLRVRTIIKDFFCNFSIVQEFKSLQSPQTLLGHECMESKM